MKDGFDTLKQGLDLSQFQMEGYLGVFVYVLLGIVATVIIQSSSATMAIIITALVANQIVYINAIELAIGANIGTTITAIMGSMTSNANGKRLAVAHFIFNIVTGIFAIIFLYQLADFTTFVASVIGISDDDYGMKLALFHTIFNIIGVIIVSPFTKKLVTFLETLFNKEEENILKPKYLDKVVLNVPEAALNVIRKETIHLYDNVIEVISHALFLHRHNFLKSTDLEKDIKVHDMNIDVDIEEFYATRIKYLYGEIISFATIAQESMNEELKDKTYDFKYSSRELVEAVKDMRDLQKNITYYMKSNNEFIKEAYDDLRLNIAKTIVAIEKLKESEDVEAMTGLEFLKENNKHLYDIKNEKIDMLIRENKIDSKMTTSFMNDSGFAYSVTKKLIKVATIIWIKDREIRNLGETI